MNDLEGFDKLSRDGFKEFLESFGEEFWPFLCEGEFVSFGIIFPVVLNFFGPSFLDLFLTYHWNMYSQLCLGFVPLKTKPML